MPTGTDLLGKFEEHSPAGIREMLAAGVSPTEPIKGTRPIDALIETYLRSSRFAECLKVMLDAGATLDDPLLQAVFLDDDTRLRGLLSKSSEVLQRKLNPLCAFTSCRGVNSIFNYCRPMMKILVNSGAHLDTRVRSLLWVESMNWETVVHDVTPISYSQCGLYRQFHRREEDVYSNIAYLYRKRFAGEPSVRNVPNKYLVVGH